MKFPTSIFKAIDTDTGMKLPIDMDSSLSENSQLGSKFNFRQTHTKGEDRERITQRMTDRLRKDEYVYDFEDFDVDLVPYRRGRKK